MKKILFLIIAAAILFPLSGCEKEIHSYKGDRGVYFAVRWGTDTQKVRWPYWSYSKFDFVQYVEETRTAEILVRITDVAVPYDREFRYEIDQSATNAIAGVDYETPEGIGIIPAGKVEGYATVVLHRTAKMQTEEVTVALQLVANENFDLVFRKFIQPKEYNGTTEEIEEEFDASNHRIMISDVLVKPSEWRGSLNSSGAEFNSFGEFSVKKIRLMFELFDLTYADFMDSSIMTMGYQEVLGRRLGLYLRDQYRNHNAVLEDDGRLMWAYGCPWTSYPGVPWDGQYHSEYF